jgi:hypothetical protein
MAAAAQATDLFRLLRAQRRDGAEVSACDAEVVDAHALEEREGVVPYLLVGWRERGGMASATLRSLGEIAVARQRIRGRVHTEYFRVESM